ncbi:MAG: hypothetical protein ACR2MF_08725 [Chthoniobacterales bacterium]
MRSRIRWRLVVGVVFIFLAGAATGFFAAAWHIHHFALIGHGPHLGARMREHLRRELHLTSEQTAKIGPVVEQTAARLETIRVETSQRVAQAMTDSREQIAPLLTPEQRERLDELEKRHQRVFQSRQLPLAPPPSRDAP